MTRQVLDTLLMVPPVKWALVAEEHAPLAALICEASHDTECLDISR